MTCLASSWSRAAAAIPPRRTSTPEHRRPRCVCRFTHDQARLDRHLWQSSWCPHMNRVEMVLLLDRRQCTDGARWLRVLFIFSKLKLLYKRKQPKQVKALSIYLVYVQYSSCSSSSSQGSWKHYVPLLLIRCVLLHCCTRAPQPVRVYSYRCLHL